MKALIVSTSHEIINEKEAKPHLWENKKTDILPFNENFCLFQVQNEQRREFN
jgi:hypothetical protein